MKAAGNIYINETLLKSFFFFFTKTMGVYIDHPKYEITRKPKILAHIRDKVVIHQNGSFGTNYTKMTGAAISLCRRISLG